MVLAVHLFMDINKYNKPILFAILTLPTVYIFAPMIELFPIALGLKIVFVSSFLISLSFGLILPVFHQQKRKNKLQFITGFTALIVFILATYNSDFSVDKKFPNSLVYIQIKISMKPIGVRTIII